MSVQAGVRWSVAWFYKSVKKTFKNKNIMKFKITSDLYYWEVKRDNGYKLQFPESKADGSCLIGLTFYVLLHRRKCSTKSELKKSCRQWRVEKRAAFEFRLCIKIWQNLWNKQTQKKTFVNGIVWDRVGLGCANLVLTEISASLALAAAHAHPLAPSVTFHSDYYFTSSVSILSD